MNKEGRAYLVSVNCHQEICDMVRASVTEHHSQGPLPTGVEGVGGSWVRLGSSPGCRYPQVHSLVPLALYIHMFSGILFLYENAPGHIHSPLPSLASQDIYMGTYHCLHFSWKPLKAVALICIKAKTGTRKACPSKWELPSIQEWSEGSGVSWPRDMKQSLWWQKGCWCKLRS